ESHAIAAGRHRLHERERARKWMDSSRHPTNAKSHGSIASRTRFVRAWGRSLKPMRALQHRARPLHARLVRGRRIVGVLAGAAVVLVVAIAAGPALLSRVATDRATRAVGTAVRVGRIGWNPFTGWWTVAELRVTADRGPAAIAARQVAVCVYLWDLVRG